MDEVLAVARFRLRRLDGGWGGAGPAVGVVLVDAAPVFEDEGPASSTLDPEAAFRCFRLGF
jgi:hypothetical protein